MARSLQSPVKHMAQEHGLLSAKGPAASIGQTIDILTALLKGDPQPSQRALEGCPAHICMCSRLLK